MKIRQIFSAYLLILSLGAFSGLSSILHSHELDLHDDHEECFSCEWSQISFEPDPAHDDLKFHSFEQTYSFNSHNTNHLIFFSPFLSRAPPSNT
jgi:hypothetical protein